MMNIYLSSDCMSMRLASDGPGGTDEAYCTCKSSRRNGRRFGRGLAGLTPEFSGFLSCPILLTLA